VTAESIYEAAAFGVSALKNSGWTEPIAPGTEFEVQVREPATSHRLTIQQIRRWCDGVAVSPDETLKKRHETTTRLTRDSLWSERRSRAPDSGRGKW
jgi:hypothetical protein